MLKITEDAGKEGGRGGRLEKSGGAMGMGGEGDEEKIKFCFSSEIQYVYTLYSDMYCIMHNVYVYNMYTHNLKVDICSE